MISRLSPYIDHGQIDNRVQGTTRLDLWFKGVDRPIQFQLAGDCFSDLAGCLAKFSCRDVQTIPSEWNKASFYPTLEKGRIGDMTASRRTYRPGLSPLLVNQLYLEWYTTQHGMFLLETDNFQIDVTMPVWQASLVDEQVQIMINQQTLRDYVAAWIRQYSQFQDDPDPLPDHHWDIRLREAEGIAIAYQEIHRKYKMEPFGDACQAFVMGWDDLLGDLATADERGTSFPERLTSSLSLFDVLSDDEAIEAQLCISHPLFQHITEMTETTQKVFSRMLTADKLADTPLAPHISTVFAAIRYITPNTLSCLLQLNESKVDYTTITRRLSKCIDHVRQAIQALGEIDLRGVQRLCRQMEDFCRDLVDMKNDLSKQNQN